MTAALAGAALLIAWVGAGPELEYTPAALAGGPWWRAWTAHLCHWSFAHLTWDWIAFVCLGVAVETRDRLRFTALVAASASAIPVALFALDPELASYRGLSGIDSALFGLAWALALGRARRSSALNRKAGPSVAALWLLGAGFAAKLGWELATASAFFMPSDSPFEPVPLAHAVGALLGVGFGALRPEGSRAPASRTGAPSAPAEVMRSPAKPSRH